MRRALLGLVLLATCGCAATSREWPAFTPVSSESAAMRWERAGKVLAGPAVFSRAADGAVQLRLGEKSPPALLELNLSPTGRLDARGALMKTGWSGPRQEAPPELAAWSSFLGIYQHARDLPPGEKEIHTARERVAYHATDGKLRMLSVMSNDTGEIVSGVFR